VLNFEYACQVCGVSVWRKRLPKNRRKSVGCGCGAKMISVLESSAGQPEANVPTAIRIGKNARGVRLIDVAIDGFGVGVEAEEGSSVILDGVEFTGTRVGVRGRMSEIAARNVRFAE